jgi:hypothetical protein
MQTIVHATHYSTYSICLVACICWCLHRGMQWAGVWLLSTRLYTCEVYVWLPACRCGARLTRYLKHPGPGSAGASKLVASLESGSRRPGSCSRATRRSQPNKLIVFLFTCTILRVKTIMDGGINHYCVPLVSWDPGRIPAHSLALKSTGPIFLGQTKSVFKLYTTT